jgi:hypothetical protein
VALAEKKGISRIVRKLRTGVGTVPRSKAELALRSFDHCLEPANLLADF